MIAVIASYDGIPLGKELFVTPIIGAQQRHYKGITKAEQIQCYPYFT
jgi:hypothetical protein